MKNNKYVIPIIIATIAIIVLGLAIFNQIENNGISDINNDESKNEGTTQIEKKLDEIQKNVDELKNLETDYVPTREREWMTSGPFQIDRKEYALGENVFLRINGLEVTEKGQVAFLRPMNSTHYSVYITIPFDGAKPSLNQYFTPDLSKSKRICSIEDIAGEWTVVFQGTNYENIKFTVSNKIIVPGEEQRYEPVC